MNDELEIRLKDFYVRMLSRYARSTMKRSLARIRCFARLGLDMFNIDVGWVYSYCDKELDNGKMKKA